jgi:hypothetical protein
VMTTPSARRRGTNDPSVRMLRACLVAGYGAGLGADSAVREDQYQRRGQGSRELRLLGRLTPPLRAEMP